MCACSILQHAQFNSPLVPSSYDARRGRPAVAIDSDRSWPKQRATVIAVIVLADTSSVNVRALAASGCVTSLQGGVSIASFGQLETELIPSPVSDFKVFT